MEVQRPRRQCPKKLLNARNLFSLNFRDMARMSLGRGSDVARVWLGCGSDELSDVVEKSGRS